VDESWAAGPRQQSAEKEPRGHPVSLPPPPAAPSPPRLDAEHRPPVVFTQGPSAHSSNGQATAALVLGIVGMLVPLLGVLAIIFGAIGMSRANQGAPGKGLAIAGLVLGILGSLVMVAALADSGY
jgi:hypothetical protein